MPIRPICSMVIFVLIMLLAESVQAQAEDSDAAPTEGTEAPIIKANKQVLLYDSPPFTTNDFGRGVAIATLEADEVSRLLGLKTVPTFSGTAIWALVGPEQYKASYNPQWEYQGSNVELWRPENCSDCGGAYLGMQGDTASYNFLLPGR